MFTGRIGEKIFELAYQGYTKFFTGDPVVTISISTLAVILAIAIFLERKNRDITIPLQEPISSRSVVAEMATEYRLGALVDVVNENEKANNKTLQDYKEFRDDVIKLIDKLEKRTTNVTLQTDINKAEIDELARISKILSVRISNLEDKFE